MGGLVDDSIYEVLLTLRHFRRVVSLNSSKEITQQSLDAFILKRSEEVKRNTLNKNIRNTHAFLNWAVRNRFVSPGLEVKVPQKPVVSLSPRQVSDLHSGYHGFGLSDQRLLEMGRWLVGPVGFLRFCRLYCCSQRGRL